MSSSGAENGATGAREHALKLMERKDLLQAELDTQMAILAANGANMNTALVDGQGFPVANIDVYAVRLARVRIIELRNDMKGLMDDIGRALEGIYDPSKPLPRVNGTDAGDGAGPSQRLEEMDPFAKVTGVAPGSPAAEAVSTRGSGTRLDDTRHILQGLQREDLVVRFGALMGGSVAGGLGSVAAYVSEHEEQTFPVVVRRGTGQVVVSLTPRSGWGGRGLLGCHIVPYVP
ncbi:hypothetical protein SISSUDRAFT_987462 [Sistotremastrum suecicum HHB10207 ss-3]|uniref:Nas2 N-terminal domain-containing protein n=1 Tax=Sistotremastrum suecicum HHB10207 ss-3 TaxID=1314776 RepID=A0A166CMT4_9AGAM|nr:hypothetical protein SISSUDRAFT_987462 [Sistotremastrum suecicum HHB10207 ss-3]